MSEATQKMPLLLPEYGRNVQKMVRWLFTIEDRDLRNGQAQAVVSTMANVYPYKRDTEEFRHMLWDHLFMIAGEGLDIDSPFERPAPEQFSPRPERLPYMQKYIVQKQYGAIVPRLAKELLTIEDPQKREKAAIFLARYMRQKSYDYNNEYPSNEVIVADLFDMTGGAIKLDQSVFNGAQIELRIQKKPMNPKGQILQNRNGNIGGNKNNNRNNNRNKK